jgi:hypothetical protein
LMGRYRVRVYFRGRGKSKRDYAITRDNTGRCRVSIAASPLWA